MAVFFETITASAIRIQKKVRPGFKLQLEMTLKPAVGMAQKPTCSRLAQALLSRIGQRVRLRCLTRACCRRLKKRFA